MTAIILIVGGILGFCLCIPIIIGIKVAVDEYCKKKRIEQNRKNRKY